MYVIYSNILSLPEVLKDWHT